MRSVCRFYMLQRGPAQSCRVVRGREGEPNKGPMQLHPHPRERSWKTLIWGSVRTIWAKSSAGFHGRLPGRSREGAGGRAIPSCQAACHLQTLCLRCLLALLACFARGGRGRAASRPNAFTFACLLCLLVHLGPPRGSPRGLPGGSGGAFQNAHGKR